MKCRRPGDCCDSVCVCVCVCAALSRQDERLLIRLYLTVTSCECIRPYSDQKEDCSVYGGVEDCVVVVVVTVRPVGECIGMCDD